MATKAQVQTFIKEVGAAALKEAKERRTAGKGWILPGICVAQGACECAWGTSKAMVGANGLFGFKVGSGVKYGDAWKGGSYNTKTKEFYGEYVTIRDNFRAYDSIQNAIADYMDLLCGASRYKGAVNNTDALNTITAIKNGGYATSPTYINTIMSIYNKYPEIAALDAEFLGVASAAPIDSTYYPAFTGVTNSIVTALQTLKVDSNFNYRKKIAGANGISNYTGTAVQNTKMLNLLKQGKLIKP